MYYVGQKLIKITDRYGSLKGTIVSIKEIEADNITTSDGDWWNITATGKNDLDFKDIWVPCGFAEYKALLCKTI